MEESRSSNAAQRLERLLADDEKDHLAHDTLGATRRILEENADRRLRRSARVVLDFFSADWTPWQTVRRLRADFPRLVLIIEPRYDDG